MSLIKKTNRSWRILKSSLYVVRKHPKLLLFPIITSIVTAFIALLFISPVLWAAAQRTFTPNSGPMQAAAQITPGWAAGYFLLIYPLSMFIATFSNVAFYSQIMAALNGENVSLGDGVRRACGRIKSIVVWSLLAGFVGAAIRELENRLGFIGRIITAAIGFTWSVAAVFAIPVLIREEPTANPLKLLKQSAMAIRKTWGETLLGYAGVGIMNSIVGVTALIIAFGSALLATQIGTGWFLIPLGLIMIPLLVAYGCLSSVASQTYLCALYIYASEGVVPEPYNLEMLDTAWRVKKR